MNSPFFVHSLLIMIHQLATHTIVPVRDISNNVVCAASKASDHCAHIRCLIRAFASLLSILWLLSY